VASMTTRHENAEVGPPITEVGVIGWLRHNLFSGLGSSIATIVNATGRVVVG